MSVATPSIRRALAHPAMTLALIAFAALAVLAPRAFAYQDANANRIDDTIERVHTEGWAAAFIDHDVTKHMLIGVENPANILYAIYVRYDHHPTALDKTTLLATGATMAWPFVNIDVIESHATWSQIQVAAAIPGVTRIEAIPVRYALNHYGSRVVRARDSRGLSASENYVLFPSARQELGLDGTGIVVAILDTGVNDETDMINPGYPGHEGLKGKFLGGGEFFCGQDVCSTPVTGSANPQDHGAEASSYHATHVAGTIMGTGGPGGFFAGVAPGARLVDCKVLSDAGASVGGSERGLDWVISNQHTLWPGLLPGSIWQGIDVVSMSLGSPTDCVNGSGTSTGVGEDLVNAAVAGGLVLCIATGNDGSTECISSPASADNSIAVGASLHARTLDRSDDKVTSFSNEGPRDDDGDLDHNDEMKPSVVAPGAGIISAFGDVTSDGTAYQQLSGTSMATPHVSGCVALLLQANPTLTPFQVRSILQNTAEHNIPTEKAAGDRGQDPFGLDANYDPSCGWGLVDVYAAAKEALNSTSGVQVVQIRAIAQPSLNNIQFKWWTQREYPFLGFNVYRAPDAGGAPGAYTKLNGALVTPTGHTGIQGVSNRTPYVYVDGSPTLTVGQQYWYKVEWVDLASIAHAEPPVAVAYGTLARIATAYFSIAHNAVDNDLQIRVGSDLDYNPGTLGQANFEVLGPGESQQDSAHVIIPATVPANTGTSTLGTIDHFWAVGFKQGDGAEPYLPPTMGHPWFLYVKDAGFVNRTGRVTSFSLFVNSSPGSSSGTTYTTNHTPMPQPTGEFGLAPATLWIPEQSPTAAVVATFRADAAATGNRLTLSLMQPSNGVSASVFRSTSDDFATRQEITEGPMMVSGDRFEYVDTEVSRGVTYYYWIQLYETEGSLWNGPVAATFSGGETVTFASPVRPNPVAGNAEFAYAIGSDIAAGGRVTVSLALHDLQGRKVRTLKNGEDGVGQYRVHWDGRDDGGRSLGAGIYYLRFTAGPVHQTEKVSVVR